MSSTENRKTTPSVVIIGAGAAGLATARKLAENNFSDFTILEAANRIGGRINSVFFGDAFIDLGAEYCHGTDGNVVYDLAKDFNLLQSSDYYPMIYQSSGKQINKEFNKELLGVMEEAYTSEHQEAFQGQTFGDYCSDKYNRSIHQKWGKNPEKLSLAKSALNTFYHLVLDIEGANSWFELSTQSTYIDLDGDAHLKWNGFGYKTVLDILMKKFPNPKNQLPIESKILLNKKVVQINWNQSTTAVTCLDGTRYYSDSIVFTPSVGVLNADHSNIFIPSLPAEKISAIKRIGIGAVMKVPLYFRNNWWRDEKQFGGVWMLWTKKDEAQSLREFPEGPQKNGRSWITDLFSFDITPANPNVLIVWFTGEQVPQIEKISDDLLLRGIGYAIRKFLGKKFNVSMPDAFLRSSWYSDPNFRGCYSYQTPASIKNGKTAEMELSEPVLNDNGRPILMFAGEASNPTLYATVHGAIETGFREAERIINFYK